MTNAALWGKPDAGNPHVRFDEGEVAPTAKPRRGSLLYKKLIGTILCYVGLASTAMALTEDDIFSPDGYTFLQYLESDGTAYIDTGVTMTSADGVELSCMAIETPASAKGIFGCRGAGADKQNISVAYDNNNAFILDFNNGSYESYRFKSNTLNLNGVTYLSN